MAGTQKVRVPQADGQIVLTPGGLPDDARTYQVDDHLVSPRNKDEQQQLLALVDGARLATAKEAAPAAPSTAPTGNPGGDKPKE